MSITKEDEISQLTFEEAMSKLQAIVGRLEKGEESLESAISIYSYADKLKTHCEKKLSEAKMKVEKIIEVVDGVAITTNLN